MVDMVTYGMAKAYADKAVNGAVTSVYTYKGRCTHAELASKTKTAGDVWAMSDSGDTWQVGQEYCYDPAANQWVAMTGLRTTVINSLSSTSTHDALSAAQGKALNDAKADRTELAGKQDVLTAGENITIVNNVISATGGGGGGGGGDAYTKAETDALLDEKQDVLTAGENITIVDNVISATGGGGGGSDLTAGSGIVIEDDVISVAYDEGVPETNVSQDHLSDFPRFEMTNDLVGTTLLGGERSILLYLDHDYDTEKDIITYTYDDAGASEQTYVIDASQTYDDVIPLFLSDTACIYLLKEQYGGYTMDIEFFGRGEYSDGVSMRLRCAMASNSNITIEYDEDNDHLMLRHDYDCVEYLEAPSWALVPSPTGNYTRVTPSAMGGGLYANPYVPVIAYGDYSDGSEPLYMCSRSLTDGPAGEHVQGTSSHVEGVTWGAVPAVTPVTPLTSLTPWDEVTLAVPTPTATDGDWGYDLDGSDAVIVSYSGGDGTVTVPSTVGGHTVKAIGKGTEGAIVTTSTVTLTLPSSLTAVNAYAFAGGYVTVSNMPSNVTTLGDRAFYGTTTEFTIPASVSTIGLETFGGDISTSSYSVDSGSQYFTVQDGVLFSKDMKRLIRFPPQSSEFEYSSYPIPSSVEVIDPCAFQNTKSAIHRPLLCEGALKIIGDSAFENAIDSNDYIQDFVLKIPSTVQYIGARAFKCDPNDYIRVCQIILPDSLISIGDEAFMGLSVEYVHTLILPSSLQSIGEDAFKFESSYGVTHLINYSSISISAGDYGLDDLETISTTPISATAYFAPINVVAGDIAPYYTFIETDDKLKEKTSVAEMPSGKTASSTVTFQDLIDMGFVKAPPSS